MTEEEKKVWVGLFSAGASLVAHVIYEGVSGMNMQPENFQESAGKIVDALDELDKFKGK